MRQLVKLTAFSVLAVWTAAIPLQAQMPPLTVPSGFVIEPLIEVPKARSMVWGDAGTLFVSTQFSGTIYAVSEPLGAEPVVTVLLEGLRIGNGVAFRNGDLYVAESTRILVYKDVESRLDNPGEGEVIIDNLPADKLHSWKYIDFGPDDKLYVSVGAPCNVCYQEDSALIARMNPDGSNYEVFARGVRNSVGFDWHPETGEFWFTDNGRDMLGDDLPPDELNRAPEAGLHFGFPFCHGKDIADPDPELAALGSCEDIEPPAIALGPHVAALGVEFYTGDGFPDEYVKQVFIAEHGSWNRTDKIGYRVTLVRLDKTGRRAMSYEVFAEGWLQDGKGVGRPVDLLTAPDGSLLVSDDKQGLIYRVSYTGSEK